jgi:hypothetical protein
MVGIYSSHYGDEMSLLGEKNASFTQRPSKTFEKPSAPWSLTAPECKAPEPEELGEVEGY